MDKSLPFHLTIFVFALAVDLLLIGGPSCGSCGNATSRSHQHRHSVAELSKANLQLEATIAENESLHQRLLAGARETGIFDERQRISRVRSTTRWRRG